MAAVDTCQDSLPAGAGWFSWLEQWFHRRDTESQVHPETLEWTPTELDRIQILCPVCDILWNLITEKNIERERRLETGMNIAQILAMDCADHKSLFRDFEAIPDKVLMQICVTV